MGSVRDYFANITGALGTTAKGMRITLRHFTSEPPITLMYPHERKVLPPTYRGKHILEQDKCIDCHLCAKACPVDCIEIEADHHGRLLEWQKFSIDYKKCIFCEFCIPPCPVDCIHMTTEYEMATDSPDDMVEDMLTWTGLRPEDEAKLTGEPTAHQKKQQQDGGGAAGGADKAALIAKIKARLGKG
jgi:NADH-quinone oxidoreductase chain I